VTAAGQRFWSDNAWVNGWAGPSVFSREANDLRWVGPVDGIDRRDRGAHLPGVVVPGFTDSHVHLGLVDAVTVRAHGIAHVLDLGWDPAEAQHWAAAGSDPHNLEVSFAGAFLTAPGGYPTTREWAPATSTREIDSGDAAAAAISEMAAFGASVVKIALNSEAGDVWGDTLLAEVVRCAHAAGLPVVAHSQGAGQALRAAVAGVDLLAHTPFTERLSVGDIEVLVARCSIISTLDIHGYGDYGTDFAVASDNLARFAAAGGRVLYGTDLGNGPLPEGINRRELDALVAADLSLDRVVAGLADSAGFGQRLSYIAGPVVRDRSDFTRWLATATVVTAAQLEEIAQ
jgi:hypothetical protein